MSDVVIDFSKTTYDINNLVDEIGEYTLYTVYLGFTPILGRTFSSPLRKDNTPSFCLYFSSKGKIRYKDFATGENGGIVEFLSKLLNLSIPELTMKLEKDFKFSNNKIVTNIRDFENYKYRNVERVSKSNLYYKSRLFTSTDKSYWGSYHISFDTLERFNVKSCEELLIVKEDYCLSYKYSWRYPMYVYIIDNGIFKIYRPYNKQGKDKWFSNCSWSDIQGFKQLPEHINRCIITKSMKDVMVLYELGYNAIATQNEGSWMLDKQLDYVYSISDESPVIFYDNDKAGLEAADKYTNKYNINSISIPQEYLEKNIKDISDYIKEYGKDKAKELLMFLLK